MIRFLQICLLVLSLLGNALCEAPKQPESEQVAALRAMQAVLAAGKYAEFYRDWCHPHLQKQISEQEFSEWINMGRGKAVRQIFVEVIAAIDAKAGKDVLIAQDQKGEVDQYEFILVAVKRKSQTIFPGENDPLPPQWHLELQLDGGKWKLMDTD